MGKLAKLQEQRDGTNMSEKAANAKIDLK